MRRKRKDERYNVPFPPLKINETETEAPKTIIGPCVSVKGEISGKEDLTVYGQFEGIIDLKKVRSPSPRPRPSKQTSTGKSLPSREKSRAISSEKKKSYFNPPESFVEI